jgi:hypothetical protein
LFKLTARDAAAPWRSRDLPGQNVLRDDELSLGSGCGLEARCDAVGDGLEQKVMMLAQESR